MNTFTEGPYKTFTAEVPADLAGKEGYLVEQVANKGTIQLLTSGLAIGALHERMQGGSDWSVRLLGKGGTMKVVAGGAITTPARVKGASGGKVVDLGASGRSVGIKTQPTDTAADGDVIEIIDVIEIVT